MGIKRYLSDHEVERLRSEAGFLLDTVRAMNGELFLALRRNYGPDTGYVNVYSRGNSLAKITLQRRGGYRVEISCEFFGKESGREGRLARFVPEARSASVNGNRYQWTVDAKQLRVLLQRGNVRALMQGIKRHVVAEELHFEQTLIADNLDRDDFIIIDRQVDEPNDDRGRLDLLALERVEGDDYRFIPLEVKLGNNPELAGDVREQVDRYVERIEERFDDYRTCYERVYEQLRTLGLIAAGPERIRIVRGTEGMVVVGGYSGHAGDAIAQLRKHAPEVRVAECFNRINRDGSSEGGQS